MLYKVVLNYESVDGILKRDHSNENYLAVISCGTVYCAVQGGSNEVFVDQILKCDHSNENYRVIFFVLRYKVTLTLSM